MDMLLSNSKLKGRCVKHIRYCNMSTLFNFYLNLKNQDLKLYDMYTRTHKYTQRHKLVIHTHT